jgi:hypothetical protein
VENSYEKGIPKAADTMPPKGKSFSLVGFLVLDFDIRYKI